MWWNKSDLVWPRRGVFRVVNPNWKNQTLTFRPVKSLYLFTNISFYKFRLLVLKCMCAFYRVHRTLSDPSVSSLIPPRLCAVLSTRYLAQSSLRCWSQVRFVLDQRSLRDILSLQKGPRWGPGGCVMWDSSVRLLPRGLPVEGTYGRSPVNVRDPQ